MRQIPEGFIIPDFGKAAGAPQASGAASDGATYDGPRKMALICSKGNLDMAYPGLILGNSAAGEGIETHMFFTFWGLDIVNKKTNDKLQFTMIGNTAMHMPDLGQVWPGLEHWSMPQFMGRLPGMTKASTKM
ncbi:MAG TPA: DsrE/DsrF/DrsH-like family protein, partial [Marmoricola sp.]|nr:DsrE/DsrF/DrsH-like family protein [Marmoricola sp.]